MKHNYQERKDNRIAFARAQASKQQKKSESSFDQAHRIGNATQGEPIKIGHHSEKRHRRDLERMDNAMRDSIEADKKADYYAEKADSIEHNRAISSDDPDALVKLRAQLEECEQKQAFMKQANKCVRKYDKAAYLKLPGATEADWLALNEGNSGGVRGYLHFELSNNNANINRLKKRIAVLEREEAITEDEQVIKGVTLRMNKEANRVQLIFPDIPPKPVRETLVRNGFRWCRSERAWQRHLNNAGRWAAKLFLEGYQP
ncbi:DUF3560 domain-containing protein [Dinghuibacter silviterrae]|uniref:Uncharacterized protein DUF3560 n=1 Tax=Dinghuibacter silviterrae TaxID=1539049 RepID=A0A4R8DHW7_9BACT|nr:DUF3560 domain-containing protein [Dinghuibacter silviterrae]TDW97135.1 uncharacterized protein DUF3560 [Dinghuibacter silviterrae]